MERREHMACSLIRTCWGDRHRAAGVRGIAARASGPDLL